jgi:uncharacterized membrane protein
MKTFTARRESRANWLVPAALITLSFIPVVAGAFRLVQLGRGAEVTPENARFFAAPAPAVLHIVSVTIYCLLGAFQFAPEFRRRRPDWHRVAGRLLVGFGVAAALSGLWMTWSYPYAPPDGLALFIVRQVVGFAMLFAILIGLAAARRRDFTRHRAWMMRGYAIGLGAGTQVITSVAWLLILGKQDETARVIVMSAGWAINIIVAEWLIRRRPARTILTASSPASPAFSRSPT